MQNDNEFYGKSLRRIMSIHVPKDVWELILKYCDRDLDLPRFVTLRDANDSLNNVNQRTLIDTSRIDSIQIDDVNDTCQYFVITLKGDKKLFYIGFDNNPRLYVKLLKIIKKFDLEEINQG